jgi:hypothetical protein
MVKEVEIRPRQYTDIIGQFYGYTYRDAYEDATKQKFNGTLKDEGKTLDLELNINAIDDTARLELTSDIMMIDYNIIDYAQRVVTSNEITDISVRTVSPSNLVYNNIDLSSVLEMPQPIIQDNICEAVEIQLFTYEANVVEEYGEKRLSVPYKVITPSYTTLGTSTDGLYTIHFATVRNWNPESQYVGGQITVYNDIAYTCLQPNLNVSVVNESYWRVTTPEDIRLFTSGNTTGLENDSLIVAQMNMLITRYFKQKLIYDVLTGLSFRTEDDDQAQSVLEEMVKYRELSLIYLEEGDPIKAAYYIEISKTQYNNFKNGKYSLSSNTNSTYTL